MLKAIFNKHECESVHGNFLKMLAWERRQSWWKIPIEEQWKEILKNPISITALAKDFLIIQRNISGKVCKLFWNVRHEKETSSNQANPVNLGISTLHNENHPFV